MVVYNRKMLMSSMRENHSMTAVWSYIITVNVNELNQRKPWNSGWMVVYNRKMLMSSKCENHSIAAEW